MPRLAIAASVSVLLIASSAGAETFPGAKAVRILDFTGTVDIAVGGETIDAVLTNSGKSYPVEIAVEDGILVIAGEERPRNYDIHREIFWQKDQKDAFADFLKDYPLLKITAPAGTDLELDAAIVAARVGDLRGKLVVGGGYVDALFGDMKSADVAIGGAGDIGVGDVAEDLRVSIGGSGDFIGGSSQTAELSVGGSGDIGVGEIRGDARIDIGGSGDVEALAIGGDVEIAIHGSGDVAAGAVGGGADLAIAGSGDIDLAAIDGFANVDIAGNGDIFVVDGRAEDLSISIAGSGDFRFGGVSTNLDVSVAGSGAVSVAKNEGTLNVTGRGADVTVGGRRIALDDSDV